MKKFLINSNGEKAGNECEMMLKGEPLTFPEKEYRNKTKIFFKKLKREERAGETRPLKVSLHISYNPYYSSGRFATLE
jgi:hypothetical protein